MSKKLLNDLLQGATESVWSDSRHLTLELGSLSPQTLRWASHLIQPSLLLRFHLGLSVLAENVVAMACEDCGVAPADLLLSPWDEGKANAMDLTWRLPTCGAGPAPWWTWQRTPRSLSHRAASSELACGSPP